jgi:2-keto-4-pentenoate hydratase/2-oxohepta-3-ene-1,7-dioic acid hydratase in catechol pathway
MSNQRRDFLKVSALAGSAVLATPFISSQAVAAGPGAGAVRIANPEMAKNMVVLNYKEGNQYIIGVKTDKGILQVAKAAKQFKVKAPVNTDDLIANGDQGLGKLVLLALSKGKADLFLDENKIEYAPAITNPEKIVCVGLNYAKHAKETNNPIPKLPILFNKFNNTLNSHNGVVAVSKVNAEKFDYEAELVIVMGKRAYNVSEADALSYVFGYATGQDFTARDLQQRSSQWMIGKTNDGFAPIGPYIFTADLVGNPNQLKIEQYVNGEVRQSSNTNDMVFNCAQIVSYTSQIFTLEPGDIIFTGTPEGVISGYPKEKQVWLKPGDKLETRIEKLGNLKFTLI